MRLLDFLILRGWQPVDDEMRLWVGEDSEPVSFWQAAENEGVHIPHLWDPTKLACRFCGITQYRVFVLEEPMKCMGVPDAQAFRDDADYRKLKDRVARLLGGEEGMLWDHETD